jgi:hypothetical protein
MFVDPRFATVGKTGKEQVLLGRFLSFTVEQVLQGKQDALKEYAIGTEVYDRKPSYHPSRDSIVRSEARRLRAKLKEYYEGEGKHDPIFIYFRLGSYVPVFRSREMLEREEKISEGSKEGARVGPAGTAIAVIRLRHSPAASLLLRSRKGLRTNWFID